MGWAKPALFWGLKKALTGEGVIWATDWPPDLNTFVQFGEIQLSFADLETSHPLFLRFASKLQCFSNFPFRLQGEKSHYVYSPPLDTYIPELFIPTEGTNGIYESLSHRSGFLSIASRRISHTSTQLTKICFIGHRFRPRINPSFLEIHKSWLKKSLIPKMLASIGVNTLCWCSISCSFRNINGESDLPVDLWWVQIWRL